MRKTRNKRLIRFLKTHKLSRGGIIDVYSNLYHEHISPTITTRVNASDCIFVLEVDDGDTNKKP